METKISEIRKEYIKGKLTQCTINDNPFEQFEEWLNDAIAHNADEPTAMIVATVSAEGHPSTRTVLLKGVENLYSLLIMKAEKENNWLITHIFPSLLYGTNWKDRYTLKVKPKNASTKCRILTFPADPIKAR